ncbi:MAG: ATP-binding protein [Reichenbachiella sp.]|uniref:ATP-binding protein n=1 Tax=Reichenbachiella sp. TaxID=2184521 RepID=UPI0032660D40
MIKSPQAFNGSKNSLYLLVIIVVVTIIILSGLLQYGPYDSQHVAIAGVETSQAAAVDHMGQKKMEELIGLMKSSYKNYPRKSIVYSEKAKLLTANPSDSNGVRDIGLYRALAYYELGIYDSIRIEAESLRTWGKRNNNSGALADATFMEGIYYRVNEDHSLELFQKALLIYESRKEKSRMFLGNFHIGHFLYSENELAEALVYGLKALALSEELGDHRGKIHTLFQVGRQYERLNLLEEAFGKYNLALELCKKYDMRMEEAKICTHVGVLYKRKGYFLEANQYLMRSLSIAESNAFHNIAKVKALIILSRIQEKLGDSVKTETYFNYALETTNQITNKPEIVSSLIQCGNLQFYLNNLDQALKLYDRALTLSNEIGNHKQMAKLFFRIAKMHNENKKYHLVEQYLNRSLALGTSLNNPKITASTLAALGKFNFELGNHQKALMYFDSAIIVSRSNRNFRREPEYWYQTSRIYFALKDYSRALIYSDTAYQAAKKNHSQEKMPTILNHRIKIFEKMGQIDSAFSSYRRLMALKRQVLSTNKSQAIGRMESAHTLVQQKREIDLLASEKLLVEKEKQLSEFQRNIFLSIAALVLFFAMGGFVYIWNRIQDRKKLEEMKSDFYLNIAHELRTPLTMLLGPLKDIKNGDNFTDYQKRCFNRITKNSEKLVVMAEEILQTSKMKTDKVVLHSQKIPFRKVLESIYVSFEMQAEEKQISYFFDQQIEEDFIWVMDKIKFEKIMSILISNAMKYCSRGDTVTLRVREDREQMVFEVEDTGPGIPSKDQSHVFKRYYQAQNAKELLRGGVGIGLSLAQELTEVLGGKLKLQSELGKGSTFVVKLPKIIFEPEARSIELVKENQEVVREIKPATDKLGSGKPKVVVVDDDLEMLEYITDVLEDEYEVLAESNGRLALKLLKANEGNMDLVITDAKMPEMDGFELLMHMKSDPQLQAIPVIVLTSLADDENRAKALKLGASEYLNKPFTSKGLLKKCAQILQISSELISTNDDRLSPL